MSKHVLALLLLLVLVRPVPALPTGPGGTLYVGTRGGATLNYYYIDLDSNWDPMKPTGASSAVVHIASVNNSPSYSPLRSSFGSPEIWSDGPTLHSAELLVGAYFNNSPVGTFPAGSEKNDSVDFLKVSSSGTVSMLNDGSVYSATGPTTTGNRIVVPVDSTFTPDHSAKGIFAGGTYSTDSCWTQSGGLYATGVTGGDISDYDAEYVSGRGLVTSGADNIRLTTWNGSVYSTTTVLSNVTPPAHGYSITSNAWVAADDVDHDGRVDYYYLSSNYNLIHAEDINGDLDIADVGEAESIYAEMTETGVNFRVQGGHDLELVETPSGRYVLLLKNALGSDTYEGGALKIYGLDSSGDWDGTWKYIITNQGTSVPAGVIDSGWSGSDFAHLEFDPVPEPATLLLVISGFTALVSLRRKA